MGGILLISKHFHARASNALVVSGSVLPSLLTPIDAKFKFLLLSLFNPSPTMSVYSSSFTRHYARRSHILDQSSLVHDASDFEPQGCTISTSASLFPLPPLFISVSTFHRVVINFIISTVSHIASDYEQEARTVQAKKWTGSARLRAAWLSSPSRSNSLAPCATSDDF